VNARRPPPPSDVAAARALLAVGPNASRDDILAAWKARVRRHHPDAVGPEGRSDAEARTKQLNAAKSILVTALELGVAQRSTAPRRDPADLAPSAGGTVRSPARPSAPSVHRPVGEAVTPIENRWLWLLGLSAMAFVVVFVITSITLPAGRSRIDGDAIVVAAPSSTTGAPLVPVPAVRQRGAQEPPPGALPLLSEPEISAAVMLETAVASDFLAQRRVIDAEVDYPLVQAWQRQVRNAGLDRADVALALSAMTSNRQPGTERARCSFPVPRLVNLAALELVYRFDAGWQVTGTVN
jgi:hypothetical protein